MKVDLALRLAVIAEDIDNPTSVLLRHRIFVYCLFECSILLLLTILAKNRLVTKWTLVDAGLDESVETFAMNYMTAFHDNTPFGRTE